MRKDVYERVKAFSINENQTASLTEYQRHFVKAALEDFERAGLALSDEDGQKLKELLEEDANVCAEYGTNLGTDSTRLLFNKEFRSATSSLTRVYLSPILRWNMKEPITIIGTGIIANIATSGAI